MRQGLGRRSGTERGNERERVREERGERGYDDTEKSRKERRVG
jgi:hypothetical protein